MDRNKSLIICIFICILLIGCSKGNVDMNKTCEDICLLDGFQYGRFAGMGYCNCFNRTIIINNTIIINDTTNINTTYTQCNKTPKERELELIRRLKFLENNQDNLIMNETECIGNESICKGKLEMFERDIDDLEDELDNCTDTLCDLNSTWC